MFNVSGVYFNENAITNARKKEQAQNRNNTLKNVALIVAAPVVAKQAAQNLNPAVKSAIVDTAANGIRGIQDLINKSVRYIYSTKSGHKLFDLISNINGKWTKSKLYKAIDNWGRNSKLWQKYGHDAGGKVITQLRTNKGLVKYAGIGLLAYGAYKTITNYFENKGAIKEKYNV